MKHRMERGEGSTTIGIPNKQMNTMLDKITIVVEENRAKVMQHATSYFHQVSQLLQTLSNVVMETRVQPGLAEPIPLEGKRIDVDIGTHRRIVQVLLGSITTGSEELNAALRQYDTINIDINVLPMFMLHRTHTGVRKEINDHKASAHDQMVTYKRQVRSIEA